MTSLRREAAPARPGGGPDRVDVLVLGSGPEAVRAACSAAGARPGSTRTGRGTSPDGSGVRVALLTARPPTTWSSLLVAPLIAAAAAEGLDWTGTRERARATAAEHRSRAAAALSAAGVVVVEGEFAFSGPGRVLVHTARASRVLHAGTVVLAHGDEPRLPDLPGATQTRHLSRDDLLEPADLPASVAVLGAGPDGCELAQALARAGASVTLLEAGAHVLPFLDRRAAAAVTAGLRRDGVRLLTGTAAVTLAPTLDDGAWIGTQGGGDVAAQCLVVATGRRPAATGPDLAAGGIATPQDVADTAHRVDGMDGMDGPAPGSPAVVVLTDPRVVHVGTAPSAAGDTPGLLVAHQPSGGPGVDGHEVTFVLTAVEARRRWRGRDWRGGRGRRRGEGRAAPLPNGDRSRARVVGVTVVGPQAGELVPVLWLCVRDRLTLAEVAGLPSSPGTAASALARAAAALRAAPARGMHP